MSGGGLESRSGSGIEERSETHTDTVTGGEIENEAETRTQSRNRTENTIPKLLRFVRHPVNVYDEILKLGETPLSLDSMKDTQLVAKIIYGENPNRLVEIARQNWQVWMMKRGRELPENAQKAQSDWAWIRTLIDVLSRYVNSAYGITGASFVNQSNFMQRLYRKIKNKPMIDWVDIARGVLDEWSIRRDQNPKALNASAHLMLKLMYYLSKS